MWFNNLMDDLKKAFLVSNQYRGIFVPIFLKLAMNIVVGIVIVVGIITSVLAGSFAAFSNLESPESIELAMSIIGPSLLFILTGYILYIVLYSLIEVGSINLYRVALGGVKPKKSDFTDVIKSYIGKVISGKLLIHFLVIILSPIIMILYLIYFISVGILSGGWGIIFISVVIDMYFATWTIGIVNDNLGPLASINKSFKFARKHFKTMFLLVLSTFMISQYSVAILGPLGAIFVGWFIAGILRTYFKLATYISYLRYNDILSDDFLIEDK